MGHDPRKRRQAARERKLDYWGGATYVFQATGQASNAAHSISLTPGEDNEMEFYYGMMSQTSGAARVMGCDILSPDGGILSHILDAVNFNSGVRVPLPYGATPLTITDAGSLPVSRWVISGDMIFRYVFTSLLSGENIEVNGVFRLFGEKPTITSIGPFEVFTIVTNEVQ